MLDPPGIFLLFLNSLTCYQLNFEKEKKEKKIIDEELILFNDLT